MKSRLDRLAELFPDQADIIACIKADMAAGLIPEPRRTWRDCQNWPEAWALIFRYAFVEYKNFFRWDGKKIIWVVWPGRDFNDKLIVFLEKITANIGQNTDLVEMRLVNTKVTENGIKRLKTIFPHALIKTFSREDAERDETIERVNLHVGWIAKLYVKKESQ